MKCFVPPDGALIFKGVSESVTREEADDVHNHK